MELCVFCIQHVWFCPLVVAAMIQRSKVLSAKINANAKTILAELMTEIDVDNEKHLHGF